MCLCHLFYLLLQELYPGVVVVPADLFLYPEMLNGPILLKFELVYILNKLVYLFLLHQYTSVLSLTLTFRRYVRILHVRKYCYDAVGTFLGNIPSLLNEDVQLLETFPH